MKRILVGIEVQPDLFGYLTVLVGWRHKPGGPVLWEAYHNVSEHEAEDVVEAVLGLPPRGADTSGYQAK